MSKGNRLFVSSQVLFIVAIMGIIAGLSTAFIVASIGYVACTIAYKKADRGENE